MKSNKTKQKPREFLKNYKENHLEDFKKSGLSLETLARAGYKSEPDSWSVPITHPLTGEEYYRRIKPDEPIEDEDGRLIKYLTPAGEEPHIYFTKLIHWKDILGGSEPIYLTEGEKKADCLAQNGFIAVAVSGVWAWSKDKKPIDDLFLLLKNRRQVICIFDSDYKEKPQVQYALNKLKETIESGGSLFVDASLPGPEKGVDDFIVAKGVESFKEHVSIAIKNTIVDVSQFKKITSEEIIETLGLTIKRDETNKLISFLGMVTAYTEDSQINISFNAPSSTGKSYIPTETSKLFPPEDVIEIAYSSPNAFFHEKGTYDKEKNEIIVDLSRKILIFLDQPHNILLERLRPLLSHDSKEIKSKITDKNQKGGNRTKTVVLKGFPVVIFCTAGLNIDEQESTRFILLSPETNQEKIREAIHEKIKKESDKKNYRLYINDMPERKLLMDRIRAIKQQRIQDVIIADPCLVEEKFFKLCQKLKPRHQRDIGRLISLVKAFAVLNCWFKEKDGDVIIADADDVNEAFKLWEFIAESQELNLPPYIYQVYKDVILPAYQEKQKLHLDVYGLSRKDILKKYYDVYGRPLQDWLLRQQILPMLENAGLISQELDLKDKRNKLIYPTNPLTISSQKDIVSSTGG